MATISVFGEGSPPRSSRSFRVTIPVDLPRGVCHCDYSSNNLLFKGDTLNALLDFDDANYTWLVYDLVNLMDNWCWSDGVTADWGGCARIVRLYSERRPLTPGEQSHLFDVHRYQIALDAAWFFDRGNAADFPERRRLEYFDYLGRAEYTYRLGLQ
jgi:homoserine kinase type II